RCRLLALGLLSSTSRTRDASPVRARAGARRTSTKGDPRAGRRGGVRFRTEVPMLKRIKAAVVPAVIVAAVAGAAGYRAQDSGSGRRLDELSKERPAAATHFPVDGALTAASQA